MIHRNNKLTEKGERNNMHDVYRVIRRLGVTSKYKGYYFLAEAVKICMEMQENPIRITKDIYPRLAKKYKSKPMNIEHNIRTIINVCWNNNRETLSDIAGCSLNYKPTNSEFVDMLAYYLMEIKQEDSKENIL